jgi:hypothetical protein
MLQPQTDDQVFVFQGEGKTIIIECVPSVSDAAELLKKALTTVRLSGMADPVSHGDVLEMTLNGFPARWGIFRGMLSGVELAALCGAAAIGETGLYFLSFINVSELTAWRSRLEKSFQSIRGRGRKATGATGMRAVSTGSPPAAGPIPWKSDLVSLSLPPGWAEKSKPRGFEKEVRGWFMNDSLPGTSLMVVCYRGLGMTLAKTEEAGIRTITVGNPGLKPVRAEEMNLPGRKARRVVLRGMAAARGQEVDIASVIAAVKADKCYVNLILTGPGTLLSRLEELSLMIAESVDKEQP